MPLWLTRLFIFAIISPELLNVDHGVDTASLVDPPHRCDPLVLGVRAHSLTEEIKRRQLQSFGSVALWRVARKTKITPTLL